MIRRGSFHSQHSGDGIVSEHFSLLGPGTSKRQVTGSGYLCEIDFVSKVIEMKSEPVATSDEGARS